VNQTIITAVNACLHANIPVLVIGEPGAAKSSVFTSLIEQGLGWHLETLIVSTREPSDLTGLPLITASGVELAATTWVRSFLALAGKPGVLMLDEMNQATPLMQGAMMRLVLEGMAGDHFLGKEIRRIGIMNPTEISAGGFDLAPPLANRLCHIEAPVERNFFLEALTKGFPPVQARPIADGWEASIPAAYALLSAFLHAKPLLHHKRPDEMAKMSKPWPSWRTWTMGMKGLCACAAMGETEEVQGLVLGGLVGSGPALEFLAYRRDLDIPDPEEILKNPEDFVLPERQDRQYAVLSAITSAVLAKNTKGRWERGTMAIAIAAKHAPDIALVFLNMLWGSIPAGAQTDNKVVLPFLPMLQRMNKVSGTGATR
jgi:hypothetical protein